MNTHIQRIETEGRCHCCGKEGAVSYEQNLSYPTPERFIPHYCPECEAEVLEDRCREAERKRQERVEAALSGLRARTPARYRGTSQAHPGFNHGLRQRMSGWVPTDERPWLGLVGPTGSCKTRFAFDHFAGLLREDAEKDLSGRRWEFISGGDFGATVLEQFGGQQGENGARQVLERVREADWLIFDEIGKVRPTPAIIDALFALIDYRHARNLWTIWTANTPPQQFCAAFPEEYAAPLAGRLVECSTIIRSDG